MTFVCDIALDRWQSSVGFLISWDHFLLTQENCDLKRFFYEVSVCSWMFGNNDHFRKHEKVSCITHIFDGDYISNF
jgi:hypothetical protein